MENTPSDLHALKRPSPYRVKRRIWEGKSEINATSSNTQSGVNQKIHSEKWRVLEERLKVTPTTFWLK